MILNTADKIRVSACRLVHDHLEGVCLYSIEDYIENRRPTLYGLTD